MAGTGLLVELNEVEHGHATHVEGFSGTLGSDVLDNSLSVKESHNGAGARLSCLHRDLLRNLSDLAFGRDDKREDGNFEVLVLGLSVLGLLGENAGDVHLDGGSGSSSCHLAGDDIKFDTGLGLAVQVESVSRAASGEIDGGHGLHRGAAA